MARKVPPASRQAVQLPMERRKLRRGRRFARRYADCLCVLQRRGNRRSGARRLRAQRDVGAPAGRSPERALLPAAAWRRSGLCRSGDRGASAERELARAYPEGPFPRRSGRSAPSPARTLSGTLYWPLPRAGICLDRRARALADAVGRSRHLRWLGVAAALENLFPGRPDPVRGRAREFPDLSARRGGRRAAAALS